MYAVGLTGGTPFNPKQPLTVILSLNLKVRETNSELQVPLDVMRRPVYVVHNIHFHELGTLPFLQGTTFCFCYFAIALSSFLSSSL